jgi:thiamine biosynthesis lipoprotein
MKKTMILLLLMLNLIFVGCTSHTTLTPTTTIPSIDNPNTTYCVASTRTDHVYVCNKIYSGYFDAPVFLKLYYNYEDDYDVEEVYDAVEDILSLYHQLLDKYNAYPDLTNAYQLNHRDTQSVQVSQALFDAIQFALEHDDLVIVDEHKLFNIALGPVLEIWHDARESDECELFLYCPVPTAQIAAFSGSIDPDDIALDSDSRTITFAHSDMRIDLGGFGKGYASERVTDYLDELGIHYLFNAGQSNVKAGGLNKESPDGTFLIGLVRPQTAPGYSAINSVYAHVRIPSGVSMVSSGNYQRYFLSFDDDLIYHHIIDPRTLFPGGEALALTVMYEDGAIADILSTAIYLMSVEAGLAYVNQTEGLEAIWYLNNNTAVYSDHFESLYLERIIPM